MARIERREPKETSGGYERLFGDPGLGLLMSKVQGTVISSGSELERMIVARVRKIDDLDVFLRDETMPDGVFIAPKKQVKNCRSLDFPEGEPDFLIFKRRDGQQLCHVVELKDGHVFDTKKASAEHAAPPSSMAMRQSSSTGFTAISSPSTRAKGIRSSQASRTGYPGMRR